MLYSRQFNYVWSSMPRTGTYSMMQFLRRNYRARAVDNWHHQVDVPPDVSKLFRFCVVRDPYVRLFSYWKYCIVHKHDPRKLTQNYLPEETFVEFLRFIVSARTDKYKNGSYYWLDQSSFVDKFRPNKILNLETIRQDLSALPFTVAHKLTIKIGNTSVPMEHKFTPEEIDLMNQHSGSDCERFGYARL